MIYLNFFLVFNTKGKIDKLSINFMNQKSIVGHPKINGQIKIVGESTTLSLIPNPHQLLQSKDKVSNSIYL